MKLSLSYPVNPLHINQHFGDNPQMYSDPKYGGVKGHNGIDFQAFHGQPVYASHDGLASFQIDNTGGHGVVIITKDQFDDEQGGQCYYKSIYWHLCDHKETQFASFLQDKTGFTPVKRGDLIGYADNTGSSLGDHLHFGLKRVAKGEDWGTWYNLEQNNGYNGAINPIEFFDGTFASDVHTIESSINLSTAIVSNIATSDITPQQKLSFLSSLINFLKILLPFT